MGILFPVLWVQCFSHLVWHCHTRRAGSVSYVSRTSLLISQQRSCTLLVWARSLFTQAALNGSVCLMGLHKSLDSFRNQWELFIVQWGFFLLQYTKICIINQKEKAAPLSFVLGHSASYLSKQNCSWAHTGRARQHAEQLGAVEQKPLCSPNKLVPREFCFEIIIDPGKKTIS